ncbi:hypothetical protein P3T36_004262 [Kitasatospora sp. MAP12-15]|uniref:hypothetical protein n=1 Tax=unclassified Kitasatospora TaxID=2633591 RepID=UPI00247547AE|nr:hypothetical protein [Kitasatospora sp. MAP12-44]MDH6108273.1 hypothetical protein [Kitasatospora sp. MAP12-44]
MALDLGNCPDISPQLLWLPAGSPSDFRQLLLLEASVGECRAIGMVDARRGRNLFELVDSCLFGLHIKQV